MAKAIRKSSSELYRPHASVSEMLGIADDICSRKVPLFGATLATEDPLERLVRRLTEGRPKVRGFTVEGRSPFIIRVPYLRGSETAGKRYAESLLWQADEDSLVHVLGLKDDYKYVARELRRYLFTDLTPVYVQTLGFKRCFDSILSKSKLEVLEISDYSTWVLSEDQKHAETHRVWLPDNSDSDDFFDRLELKDHRIRSLGLYIAKTRSAKGRIRRDLSFSCDSGFRLFFTTVVKELCIEAAGARGIFVDRGATTSPTHTPRPLQISYSAPIFEDKAHNRRLINVLKTLPDAALSVFHPNPYLHASLIDYADGSSYTIWITDNSSISIVPELKASAGSLERLCNHISERFGEGAVEEVPT